MRGRFIKREGIFATRKTKIDGQRLTERIDIGAELMAKKTLIKGGREKSTSRG